MLDQLLGQQAEASIHAAPIACREDVGMCAQLKHLGEVCRVAQIQICASFTDVHAQMLGVGIGIRRRTDMQHVCSIFSKRTSAAGASQYVGEVQDADAL
ncbi:hypothetical protein WS65_19920 [Burkholderia anthina]|nr:hypothetical protein WS65_19920 [Burkholderia anthina]